MHKLIYRFGFEHDLQDAEWAASSFEEILNLIETVIGTGAWSEKLILFNNSGDNFDVVRRKSGRIFYVATKETIKAFLEERLVISEMKYETRTSEGIYAG